MSAQVINIILDSLVIISGAVAVLVSFTMILIMLFHKSTIKRDRSAHLLCINMYVSVFIGCALVLEIYCYTLYGHLYGNISFDGQWCYVNAYFFYVSGCGFFYACLLQAIYRLCRIVFYMKPSLQSFKLYIYGIIIQWILSFLQVIPLLVFHIFEYLPEDYHCQIAIHNVRGLLIGLLVVYMIPISLTTSCYIYTMIYIRKRSAAVKTIRQQANDRRDFLVLKQIFILLSILIISGIPMMGITLYFQFSGYLPYWSTQFQWLTATFSICSIAVILIFISPNIPKFWRRTRQTQVLIPDT